MLIGIGLYQGYRGISRDFLKDSKTEEMSPKVKDVIESLGVFGHLARMVVFGLVGVFLIKAASRLQSEARRSASTARSRSSRTPRTGRSCSGSSPQA